MKTLFPDYSFQVHVTLKEGFAAVVANKLQSVSCISMRVPRSNRGETKSMVALVCLCDTHFHKTLREAPVTQTDEN